MSTRRWRVGDLVWIDRGKGRPRAGVVVARGDVRVGVAHFNGEGRRVHALLSPALLRTRGWGET